VEFLLEIVDIFLDEVFEEIAINKKDIWGMIVMVYAVVVHDFGDLLNIHFLL
jgi:hypothetical protein